MSGLMIGREVETLAEDARRTRELLEQIYDYYIGDKPRDKYGAASTPRGLADDPIYTAARKAPANPTVTQVSLTAATSMIAVAANPKRLFVIIQNANITHVSIKPGAAAVSGEGLGLTPASFAGAADGGIYSDDFFRGEIWALSQVGAGTVNVIEYSEA